MFFVITQIARLLTKSLDLHSCYSLGNLVYCYGNGKRCYCLTSYALLIITNSSLLFSSSMFLLDEL
jgi:hypothetical protein